MEAQAEIRVMRVQAKESGASWRPRGARREARTDPPSEPLDPALRAPQLQTSALGNHENQFLLF